MVYTLHIEHRTVTARKKNKTGIGTSSIGILVSLVNMFFFSLFVGENDFRSLPGCRHLRDHFTVGFEGMGEGFREHDKYLPEENGNTFPEHNVAPENRPSQGPQKETIVFQPSIFRCELLVSGRVLLLWFMRHLLFDCWTMSSGESGMFVPRLCGCFKRYLRFVVLQKAISTNGPLPLILMSYSYFEKKICKVYKSPPTHHPRRSPLSPQRF